MMTLPIGTSVPPDERLDLVREGFKVGPRTDVEHGRDLPLERPRLVQPDMAVDGPTAVVTSVDAELPLKAAEAPCAIETSPIIRQLSEVAPEPVSMFVDDRRGGSSRMVNVAS